jgi:hypothetical protein
MAFFGLPKSFKKIDLGDKLKKFIDGPDDDALIERVKSFSNNAAYASDIWGDSGTLQTLALMREIPAMIRDPVIESALGVIMETAFQMNDEQEVLWVTSPSDTIKKELDKFHEDVGMQQQSLTIGYNLLLWGNLPFRHYFDPDGKFVHFMPLPDFTQVTPIIVSGKTLGFLSGGEFHYPYEFTYAQLDYMKNLGGIYRNNFVQLSGMSSGLDEDMFGQDFQNEFVIAPSYLSTAARPWKNINIIEDALLLNRMDQSNYYRIFSVNVGGSVHSKSAIRTLNFYRNLFKKVRRVSYDASGMASKGSGQEFEVIIPKTEKQSVDVSNIGGDVEVRAIKDLETQYNKLFAALKIQPSQIGFGEEQSNAIGDTNGQSYDRRLARTCKSLVYSVQRAIKNFDYLYLRSRGYDVSYKDWSYGTVSLSVMDDQARAETLEKALDNLKSIADTFNSVGLDAYNKNYLIESLLGNALSSTGVDVQEVLKVDENQPPPGGKVPVTASVDFRTAYLEDMLDTMESTSIMSKGFISNARDSLNVDRVLISSAKIRQSGSVPYSALDDMALMLQDDTLVDLTGAAFFMPGKADTILSDFTRVQDAEEEHLVTLDFGQTLLVPQDISLSVGDFNTAGIRALGRGFINSRGELILVDKADIASYLYMKKSGLYSCLVSSLHRVP